MKTACQYSSPIFHTARISQEQSLNSQLENQQDDLLLKYQQYKHRSNGHINVQHIEFRKLKRSIELDEPLPQPCTQAINNHQMKVSDLQEWERYESHPSNTKLNQFDLSNIKDRSSIEDPEIKEELRQFNAAMKMTFQPQRSQNLAKTRKRIFS